MKKEAKVIEESVKWISQIKPELQVEVLTAAVQRAIWNHAQAVKGLGIGVALTAVGCFGYTYFSNKVIEEELKDLKAEIRNKVYDFDNEEN